MRPQRAARMPGSTACTQHLVGEQVLAERASGTRRSSRRMRGPPGGPPVLLTRMCTGLRAASACDLRAQRVGVGDVGGDPAVLLAVPLRGRASTTVSQRVGAARQQGDVGAEQRELDARPRGRCLRSAPQTSACLPVRFKIHVGLRRVAAIRRSCIQCGDGACVVGRRCAPQLPRSPLARFASRVVLAELELQLDAFDVRSGSRRCRAAGTRGRASVVEYASRCRRCASKCALRSRRPDRQARSRRRSVRACRAGARPRSSRSARALRVLVRIPAGRDVGVRAVHDHQCAGRYACTADSVAPSGLRSATRSPSRSIQHRQVADEGRAVDDGDQGDEGIAREQRVERGEVGLERRRAACTWRAQCAAAELLDHARAQRFVVVARAAATTSCEREAALRARRLRPGLRTPRTRHPSARRARCPRCRRPGCCRRCRRPRRCRLRARAGAPRRSCGRAWPATSGRFVSSFMPACLRPKPQHAGHAEAREDHAAAKCAPAWPARSAPRSRHRAIAAAQQPRAAPTA